MKSDEILRQIENAIFDVNNNAFSIEIKLMEIKSLIRETQKLEYIIIGLLAVMIIGIVAVLWNQRKIKKQLRQLLEEREKGEKVKTEKEE